MPYYEKITDAGITESHECYHDWSRPEPGGKRERQGRTKPTPEGQRKNNLRRAMQRLTMDLNGNFGPDCWYLTFNYAVGMRPKDKQELVGQMTKVLRKLRNIYRKDGKVLRYVWVPEVGPRGGSHIHIVLSEINPNLIRDVWPYGGFYMEPLRKDRNYRKLAGYFIDYSEVTRKSFGGKQAGRYNPSRNLIHAEPKERNRRKKTFSANCIQVPDGWYLDKGSVQEWVDESQHGHLYYLLVRLQEDGKGMERCRT